MIRSKLLGVLSVALFQLATTQAFACNEAVKLPNTSALRLDNSSDSAFFSFSIAPKDGSLVATSSLSFRPTGTCEVCLFARVQAGASTTSLRQITCKTTRRRLVTTFTARMLPPLSNSSVLNMATRTTCDSEIIESNAFARTPTCGVGRALSTSRYIQFLKSRVK